ncbi:hypothetical protein MUK42_03487 [Musa troglodytarum]|uniref:Uncharacterized protein n=1 Tax=Musa troglodytarum TaxID=320322 RepID=A0A9E7HXV3_9LILI|nr:hypothetical protein MUK42_03487 [Musa troglodytarum]
MEKRWQVGNILASSRFGFTSDGSSSTEVGDCGLSQWSGLMRSSPDFKTYHFLGKDNGRKILRRVPSSSESLLTPPTSFLAVAALAEPFCRTFPSCIRPRSYPRWSRIRRVHDLTCVGRRWRTDGAGTAWPMTAGCMTNPSRHYSSQCRANFVDRLRAGTAGRRIQILRGWINGR